MKEEEEDEKEKYRKYGLYIHRCNDMQYAMPRYTKSMLFIRVLSLNHFGARALQLRSWRLLRE